MDARKLIEKLTIDDIHRLFDSLNINISSETNKEICLFQYDRYPVEEVFFHKPKLYYYINTKIFKNYITNKAYDIYGFLQEYYAVNNNKINFPEAINIVENYATGEEHVSKWELKLNKYKRKNYRPEFKDYNNNELNDMPRSYPQEWIDYGISKQACDTFDIKEYKRLSQIVMPIKYKNKLIGIRIRNRDPTRIKDDGKYRPLQTLNTLYNFSTNSMLYGWDVFENDIKEKKFVYLAEAEKSVLKAYSWFGHDKPTVGMFGHSLSQWKRDMIVNAGVKTVYYVADCDFSTAEEKQIWYNNIKVWCQPLIAAGLKVYVVADWNLEFVNSKENAFDAESPLIFNEIFNRKELIA